MPELQAAQAQLWEDWLAKLTDMVAELQARGVVRAERDPYALALLWSSVTAGLAAHHLANPEIELARRSRSPSSTPPPSPSRLALTGGDQPGHQTRPDASSRESSSAGSADRRSWREAFAWVSPRRFRRPLP